MGSSTFSVQSHAANSIHGSLKGFSHLFEICWGTQRVILSSRGREGDSSQRVKLQTWSHDSKNLEKLTVDNSDRDGLAMF